MSHPKKVKKEIKTPLITLRINNPLELFNDGEDLNNSKLRVARNGRPRKNLLRPDE